MSEIKCPGCGKVIPIDEADFSAILNQVRTGEFDKEIEKREKELKKNLEEKHALDIKSRINEVESSKDKEISSLKQSVSNLEQKIKSNEENQKLKIDAEIAKAVKPKDEKISELSFELNRNIVQQELAVRDAVDKIKAERDIQKAEYEAELKKQRELVKYYKDFKTSLSTKMVGESLEQHCELEFRKIQGYFQPGRVTFGKDNTVAENSKGDYIYRELDEYGNELLSIMFE